MAQGSKISWTDWTLNAIYGCREVSAGCDHCYAATLSHRYGAAGRASGRPNVFEGLTEQGEDGTTRWSGAIRVVPERLEEPIRKTKPQRIFVNSLSDLFYARIPREVVDLHWAAMALAPQHQFQILTKRPERMARYLLDPEQPGRVALQVRAMVEDGQRERKPWARRFTWATKPEVWPLPNVWLGTSVESQDVIGRVGSLLLCPAAVRFLSVEPLIGPVDLAPSLAVGGLHWVIVGGESGPGHRPMDLDWARKVRDDCARANVPFFYKQAGGPKPGTGTTLDGQEHHAFPADLPAA